LWNVDSILSLTHKDIAGEPLIVAKAKKNTEPYTDRFTEWEALEKSGSVAFDRICAISPNSKPKTAATNLN
jgi:hypothetical protein